MDAQHVLVSKNRRAWTILLTVLVLLTILLGWRSAEKAMNMKSGMAAAGSQQFAAFKPGETVKIVLEVVDVASAADIKGNLLNKLDDSHYVRTQASAEVSSDANTAVVMGKATDVVPGAIIQVTGTITASHAIQARQIVVLTGYVHLQ